MSITHFARDYDRNTEVILFNISCLPEMENLSQLQDSGQGLLKEYFEYKLSCIFIAFNYVLFCMYFASIHMCFMNGLW
jgi:hypothetical protein